MARAWPMQMPWVLAALLVSFSGCSKGTGPGGKHCTRDDQCPQFSVCDTAISRCACKAGFHLCGSDCVPSTTLDTCGALCTPCPPPPENASAVCDGIACGFVCSSGFHRCADLCLSDHDVQSCGTRCEPCAPVPLNAVPTCDGMSCGYECNYGYHPCAGVCASSASTLSCGTQCTPCPAPDHAVATCNGSHCGFVCEGGHEMCDNHCVDLLQDGSHCGACGHSCEGKPCWSGRCEASVLATTPSGFTPVALAVGQDSVVWVSQNVDAQGLVLSVIKDGSQAPTTLAEGESAPADVAIHEDGTVYWTSAAALRQKRPGAAAEDFVAGEPSSRLALLPGGLATDGGVAKVVYWTHRAGNVVKRAVVGGAAVVETLASGTAATSPAAISLGGGGVVWGNAGGGLWIWKENLDEPVRLAAASQQVDAVAVDNSFIYWADAGAQQVAKAALALPTPPDVNPTQSLVEGANDCSDIVVDAMSIYWIERYDGSIKRATLAGAGVTTLASGQQKPLRLALDGKYLYWVNDTDRKVLRVPK